MPTDRRVLFGHHFAAIGRRPAGGPVLATQMGYLPGTIWIIIGAVFAGVCRTTWCCRSRRAAAAGRWARWRATNSAPPAVAAIVGVLVIMTILLAVLALVVVNALAESPWGSSPSR